ncbi:hypothetical protein HDU87_006382 [Geranomyces variabilis]|uniref:Uncharacterized protein n=1 Tax=Geranomyces variabilis TaxID=109894 RepID=A0AAD5XNZ6_9FUNG|nr:hypothetical protein HDU87_006382 [Geranomyces variabilis]
MFRPQGKYKHIQAQTRALWDSFADNGELAYTKTELLIDTIEFENNSKLFNEFERGALRHLCAELEIQKGSSGGFTCDEFLDMVRRTTPMLSRKSPSSPSSPSPALPPPPSSDNMAERMHKMEETVEDLKDIVQQLSNRLSLETAAKQAALSAVKDLEERIEKLEAESLQAADLNHNLQSELEAAERKARENQSRDAIEIERLQARQQELDEELQSKDMQIIKNQAETEEVQRLRDREQKLQDEVERAENQAIKARRRVSELENEATEARKRISEWEIEQKSQDHNVAEIDSLRAREQELENKVEKAENEAIEARKRVLELENEATEKNLDHNVAEIDSLRAREQELENKVEKAEKEAIEARKRMAEMPMPDHIVVEIDGLRARHQKLQHEATEARKRVSELENEATEARKRGPVVAVRKRSSELIQALWCLAGLLLFWPIMWARTWSPQGAFVPV